MRLVILNGHSVIGWSYIPRICDLSAWVDACILFIWRLRLMNEYLSPEQIGVKAFIRSSGILPQNTPCNTGSSLDLFCSGRGQGRAEHQRAMTSPLWASMGWYLMPSLSGLLDMPGYLIYVPMIVSFRRYRTGYAKTWRSSITSMYCFVYMRVRDKNTNRQSR